MPTFGLRRSGFDWGVAGSMATFMIVVKQDPKLKLCANAQKWPIYFRLQSYTRVKSPSSVYRLRPAIHEMKVEAQLEQSAGVPLKL